MEAYKISIIPPEVEHSILSRLVLSHLG